jgi:hypothetical protein
MGDSIERIGLHLPTINGPDAIAADSPMSPLPEGQKPCNFSQNL